MKKNVTVQMNNGVMVNARMMAYVMNIATKMWSYAKEISSNVKNLHSNVKNLHSNGKNLHSNGRTICEEIISKIAEFYSKELEEEITPAKALLLIKAQIAFGAVIITSACAPLCLASAVWFTVACLKVRNYKEEG